MNQCNALFYGISWANYYRYQHRYLAEALFYRARLGTIEVSTFEVEPNGAFLRESESCGFPPIKVPSGWSRRSIPPPEC